MIRIVYPIIFLTLVLSSTGVIAQIEKGNEYDALNLNITYGAHLPGADFAQRFGFHFSVGLGLDYIQDPSNVIIGLESNYQFGGIVKEDVISSLRTPEGEIIGNDLQFASVNLRQRGLYTGFVFGKLFQTHSVNKKEGIRATIGAGYVWHKIRIQDDFDTAPQFSGDYVKGYDRLTAGLGIRQFIGYQKLDRNRLANFMVGLEFMQAFTSSVREFNWDTREFPQGRRLDISFGIRVAWTLPFYVGQPSSTIYY
jgi:hypothetical protein